MLKILKVGTSLGGNWQGCEQFPKYLTESGIEEIFNYLDYDYSYIDLIQPSNLPKVVNPKVENYAALNAFNKAIYRSITSQVKRSDTTLVFGGDASVGVGAMMATKTLHPQSFVLNISARSGCHTPSTSQTGLMQEMTVSTVLGDSLWHDFKMARYYYFESAIFGANDFSMEQQELEYVKGKNIKFYSLSEITKNGLELVLTDMLRRFGHKPVHLNFDFSVIDELVHNHPYIYQGGFNYRELKYIFNKLKHLHIKSVCITGFNPNFAKPDIYNLVFETIFGLLRVDWTNRHRQLASS